MSVYLKKAAERPAEDLSQVRETVRQIIEKVRREGEDAVRYYSEKFDKWAPASFKISEDDMRSAKDKLPATMVADIDFCQAQIRNFAQEQMKRLADFEVETMPGVWLGQKVIPVASSGSYVPGGRYPMLASAHMTVITPKVAGVAEGGGLHAAGQRRRHLSGHAVLNGGRRRGRGFLHGRRAGPGCPGLRHAGP